MMNYNKSLHHGVEEGISARGCIIEKEINYMLSNCLLK